MTLLQKKLYDFSSVKARVSFLQKEVAGFKHAF